MTVASDAARPDGARRLDARDAGLVLVILAALAVYVWRTFDFALPLYEDAAILMRYSRHLAEGHGIVWNVGRQPVDGATDFLLMVTLAGIAKLGTTVDFATYLLGFASHALTVLVLYAGSRKLYGAPRWLAFVLAGYFAFGPGIRYVEAYFGTPYFGLFAATAWYYATRAYRFGATTSTSVCFAIHGLLLGLTRPEGVFLAGFMLLAVVLTRGRAASTRLILWFVLVFGTLGTAYFAWRWQHFGYPLPNTYYIKGGKTIHWGHLMGGVKHLVALGLPVLPIVAYALLIELGTRRKPSRDAVFVLTPIVAFTVIGVLHEGLMDYLHRFQYCLLPVLLMGATPLVLSIGDAWRGGRTPTAHQRLLAKLLVVLVAAGALAYQVRTFPTGGHKWWGTYNVARILADYQKGYSIAVTNAGHLPYVSRWDAIDAWGLNDQELAHDGLTEEYLDRWKPEVIQFDGGFSPLWDNGEVHTPWGKATQVMKAYAEENGYVLAAAFGVTPYKSHYYWVRSDCPDRDELVRRIREVDYYIGGSPARCFDFAAVKRGE